MKRSTRVIAILSVGSVLTIAGGLGAVRRQTNATPPPAVATAAAARQLATPQSAEALIYTPGSSVEQMIATLQAKLKTSPKDYVSMSTLGLAYVQHAKVTVDSSFYPIAEQVLKRSLALNSNENFLAYAGLSALASARHNFPEAKSFAERGLAINSYSAVLYGALSDAQIQLGEYTDAFQTIQRMVDLSPDTSSLARASYTWELRGDVVKATSLMERALDDAPNASSRAFALTYLGELAFNSGDANKAVGLYNEALAVSPSDIAARAGKARAIAALGQNLTAISLYDEVVTRAPEPSYLMEYGELLESLGRVEEAQQQYDVFTATQKLFAVNGVQSDATAVLFDANHGDPKRALAEAEKSISGRPFLVVYDAYAWALHKNGRENEALKAESKAMSLGFKSALFRYHAGMIKAALGDTIGARAELTEALAMNPAFNSLDVLKATEALKKLTSSG